MIMRFVALVALFTFLSHFVYDYEKMLDNLDRGFLSKLGIVMYLASVCAIPFTMLYVVFFG